MITNNVNLLTNPSVNGLKDVHETNTIKTKVLRCKHSWNLKTYSDTFACHLI